MAKICIVFLCKSIELRQPYYVVSIHLDSGCRLIKRRKRMSHLVFIGKLSGFTGEIRKSYTVCLKFLLPSQSNGTH